MRLFENKVLSLIVNFILDTLFTLILLFSIIMTFLAISRYISPFGFMFGVVQSKSMEASNLYVGDVVTITKQDEYKVGDIIAFYRDPSKYDNKNVNDIDVKKTPVWIHEIIDIRVDEKGNYSYLTKGTSNPVDDFYYVPYEFVLGIGKPLSDVMNKTIGFIVSPIGIICLIIIPCLIMLVYLTWELFMTITSPDYDAPFYWTNKHKYKRIGDGIYLRQRTNKSPIYGTINLRMDVIPLNSNQNINAGGNNEKV